MGTQSQESLDEDNSQGSVQAILVAPYWLVSDPEDRTVPSVQPYLQDFWARGMSSSSVESYARDLLRWFRFLQRGWFRVVEVSQVESFDGVSFMLGETCGALDLEEQVNNSGGRRRGHRKPLVVLGIGVLLGVVLGCQGPVTSESPATQSTTAALAPAESTPAPQESSPAPQESILEPPESVPAAGVSSGGLLAADEVVRRLKAAGVCSDVFVATGLEKKIVVCEVSGSASSIPTTVQLLQAEKIDQAINALKLDCSSCMYSRAGENWFVSSTVSADLEWVVAAILGSDKGGEWGDSPLALRTMSQAESDLLCQKVFPDPQAAALIFGLDPDPAAAVVEGASYYNEPRADLVSVSCAIPITGDPLMIAYPANIFWEAGNTSDDDETVRGRCAQINTLSVDWSRADRAAIVAAADKVCD